MIKEMPQSWKRLLPTNISSYAFSLSERAASIPTYPPTDKIFAALERTPPSAVKVVILGQDPYHEEGQANGLAFSVNQGTPLPPSLKNIFMELESDLGVNAPSSGDLTSWAKQGVLLLNTVLTVCPGVANSCAGWGWQQITGEILSATLRLPQPIVYLLWGKHAQGMLIDSALPPNKFCIRSAHPSPLSAYRGFFGSKPFSRANDYLVQHGSSPVKWNV